MQIDNDIDEMVEADEESGVIVTVSEEQLLKQTNIIFQVCAFIINKIVSAPITNILNETEIDVSTDINVFLISFNVSSK